MNEWKFKVRFSRIFSYLKETYIYTYFFKSNSSLSFDFVAFFPQRNFKLTHKVGLFNDNGCVLNFKSCSWKLYRTLHMNIISLATYYLIFVTNVYLFLKINNKSNGIIYDNILIILPCYIDILVHFVSLVIYFQRLPTWYTFVIILFR